MPVIAAIIGSVAPVVLNKIFGGGGSKKNKQASRAASEGAQAETALKQGQLSAAEQIMQLILGKGQTPGLQFPKLGGGLDPEMLSMLGSGIPLSILAAIPGFFQSGSGATQSAARSSSLEEIRRGEQLSGLSSDITSLIQFLLSNKSESPTANAPAIPIAPPEPVPVTPPNIPSTVPLLQG